VKLRDDGKRVPCAWCKTVTAFVITTVGKRGAKHTDPCCPTCGETPALREKAAA
jgi:hypothetical protein